MLLIESSQLKLLQEAQVVFIEHPNVFHIEFQHGDAFDTQPECIAGDFFRVVGVVAPFHAYGAENIGMHHPRPAHLQPAAVLAHPAALHPAEEAGHIHFG